MKENDDPTSSLNRREFIKRATVAGAGAKAGVLTAAAEEANAVPDVIDGTVIAKPEEVPTEKRVRATYSLLWRSASRNRISRELVRNINVVLQFVSWDKHICMGLSLPRFTKDGQRYEQVGKAGVAASPGLSSAELHECAGGNTCAYRGSCGTGPYKHQYWVAKNSCSRASKSQWSGRGGCGTPIGSGNTGYKSTQLNSASVPSGSGYSDKLIGVPVWNIARSRFENDMNRMNILLKSSELEKVASWLTPLVNSKWVGCLLEVLKIPQFDVGVPSQKAGYVSPPLAATVWNAGETYHRNRKLPEPYPGAAGNQSKAPPRMNPKHDRPEGDPQFQGRNFKFLDASKGS